MFTSKSRFEYKAYRPEYVMSVEITIETGITSAGLVLAIIATESAFQPKPE